MKQTLYDEIYKAIVSRDCLLELAQKYTEYVTKTRPYISFVEKPHICNLYCFGHIKKSVRFV
jgi:hypothetical protein